MSRRPSRPRLDAQPLEDRTTPAVAFSLSGTNLLSFDTAAPTVTQSTAITGVNGSETLVGIDFRPQNGFLYGLGVNATNDNATLYAISSRTGVATAVGTTGGIAFTTNGVTAVDLPDPATVGYGFDFDPARDQVRIVAGSLNFRVDPNTGLGLDGDNGTGGAVGGTNPDGPITGGTSSVGGAAYTNNAPNNGNITTLYTLDAASNSLFIQNTPNSGTQALVDLVTLGGFTLDFTAVGGFDIPAGVNAGSSNAAVASGSAFAVLNVGGTTGLYSINLTTGAATLVGNVGNGTAAVQGLAVEDDRGGLPAIGLDATGTNLIRFNTATSGTVTTQALNVASLAMNEQLVGIDFRPATGQLYGLAVNATANTASLYLIDPQLGGLTAVGTQSQIAFVDAGGSAVDLPDPATVGYGFDFNPTADRVRVTTASGLNFRVNPITGAPIDGNLNSGTPAGINTDGLVNGGGVAGVSGVAYTNSFGGATVTTLYTLDPASESLLIQVPPNAGTQTSSVPVTLAGNPLIFTDVNGFDIPVGVRTSSSDAAVTSGFGYAALTVGGVTSLYEIDLTTGVATDLGTVGAGSVAVAGFTLADAPAGAVSFAATTGSVAENGGSVTINLTRTGGDNGPLTVTVNVTGGSATAGSDFTGGPYTATFADGATTASFTIPILDDTLVEGSETIVLSVASVDNAGVIGGTNVATVVITDVPPAPPAPLPPAPPAPLPPGPLPAPPAPPAPQPPAPVAATSSGTDLTFTKSDGTTVTLKPFGGFSGGFTVGLGDVTGDGVADIVTGAGAGGGPHVKVFDGASGALVRSFFAYGNFSGGVFVAVGDVDGDGFADIATGAGAGGSPHVKVFSGRDGSELYSFFAYPGFSGGVRVALGDVNGDGKADIVTGVGPALFSLVTGSGSLGSTHVKAFSGADGSLLSSFFAFSNPNVNGVFVAAGDLDGDGKAEIVVGAGSGGTDVRVFNGNGSSRGSFPAFEAGFSGGVRVAVRDANGDGTPDILAAAGPGGGPNVRSFDGRTFAQLGSVFAGDPRFLGGVFV